MHPKRHSEFSPRPKNSGWKTSLSFAVFSVSGAMVT